MIAIIDGDIPIYTECASAASRGSTSFGDYYENVEELVERVIEVCDDWADQAGCDSVILAYTHPDRVNFRKDVLPGQYKAGRPSEKPPGYYAVLEEVAAHYKSHTIRGVEGDDVCGILHTSEDLGPTVNISTDKDFRTLPGLLFNPMKMVEPELISVNDAIRYWMYQTLMGDSTDGYKGAPRIGQVKAARILDDRDGGSAPEQREYYRQWTPSFYLAGLWQAVYNTYVEAYPLASCGWAHQEALRQARCARILQRCDYDSATGQIRLWHPDVPEWIMPGER